MRRDLSGDLIYFAFACHCLFEADRLNMMRMGFWFPAVLIWASVQTAGGARSVPDMVVPDQVILTNATTCGADSLTVSVRYSSGNVSLSEIRQGRRIASVADLQAAQSRLATLRELGSVVINCTGDAEFVIGVKGHSSSETGFRPTTVLLRWSDTGLTVLP